MLTPESLHTAVDLFDIAKLLGPDPSLTPWNFYPPIASVNNFEWGKSLWWKFLAPSPVPVYTSPPLKQRTPYLSGPLSQAVIHTVLILTLYGRAV